MYATTKRRPIRRLGRHRVMRRSAPRRRTRALAWFFTKVMAVRLAQAVQESKAVAS